MPKASANSVSQPAQDRYRFSLRQLLAAMVGIGVVFALLGGGWQAVSTARRQARELEEMGHFKQVALVLHIHHDVRGSFPPACEVDAFGKPFLSWRTPLTPYLEVKTLWNRYDKSKPWDSPANDTLCRTAALQRWIFRAPDQTNSDPACTNIVMPTGRRTVGQGVSLADITDDHTTTILLLSLKPSDILWHEPRDLDVSEITRADGDPQRIVIRGQLFTGGIAAMVDGSVHRLPADLPYDVLMAMLTVDQGESIDAKWLDGRGSRR